MQLGLIAKLKVIIVYKQSSLSVAGKLSSKLRNTRRFERNHRAHYSALRHVEAVLRSLNIPYHKKNRDPRASYSDYDLIVTVGGDGTVLDAARNALGHQLILGVNSDPEWSVGQFCSVTAVTFRATLLNILRKKYKTTRLYKLRLILDNGLTRSIVECLNDILICHANPAAMSRYELRIGKKVEEQRSSGIWFSSAAGSTGAIRSAGGKNLPLASRSIQYLPRELYWHINSSYKLTGGVLSSDKKITLVSYMPKGRVFIDGAHVRFPLSYSHKAIVSSSPNYVQLVR